MQGIIMQIFLHSHGVSDSGISHTVSSKVSSNFATLCRSEGEIAPTPAPVELAWRGAKGMAEVEVKTGRSARFITIGVAVLGGSHCKGCCCS